MRIKNWLLAAIIAVVLVIMLSAYTVMQTQEGIVMRLGKIVTENGKPLIVMPGLHFKIPFIESVKLFDIRLRTLSVESSRIVTEEQKDVLVDAYVKWRISNIVQYYKATSGLASRAEALLQQKLNASMRAEFGRQTIQQLVAQERTEVMQRLRVNLIKVAKPLGIEVIDVRVKRIDLPTEVQESIYARMRSNREKEASLIRAQGKELAEQIRADADARSTVILAEASSQAAKIKAEGIAKAASIYAKSYEQDPSFYSFYRSLKAYQVAFHNENDTLVLRPKNQFFNHFNATNVQ